MSDRIHFPKNTRLTTEMLNGSFDALEVADQRILSDLGIKGIIAGLDVTISDDGSAACISPGIAYDRLGRRVKVDTPQTLPLLDDNVARAEKFSVIVKFARRETDPILDSYGRVVARRQFESFAFAVRPHAADADDEILVCDVSRRSGQMTFVQQDIDLSRRSYPVVWRSTGIGTDPNNWQAIEPATTVQLALDHVDAAIRENRNADKVLLGPSSEQWQSVKPASNAQEALDHVDKAIHAQRSAAGVKVDCDGWKVIKGCSNTQEALDHVDKAVHAQSSAAGITVDSARWAAIRGCRNAQEALTELETLAKDSLVAYRSLEGTLEQTRYDFAQFAASPREFAKRAQAVVVFQTSVGIRPMSPGNSIVRSLTVRGLKMDDIALSMRVLSTSPQCQLMFEPIGMLGDNFLECRVSAFGNNFKNTTETIMVALRVVAAVVPSAEFHATHSSESETV